MSCRRNWIEQATGYLMLVHICRFTGHRITPLCNHILRVEGEMP